MAKRKLSKKGKTLILTIILALLFISGVSYYYWWDGQRIQENILFDDAFGTEVITALIPSDTRARIGEQRRIKYIVIHETDNFGRTADASNHSVFLLNNPEGNSWHYTVDDRVIYRHVPDNEVAWHAGEYIGNRHGIGIELCVNEGSDFEQTLDNAARLTAKLLKLYHLPISAIKQHHDFSGKDCPNRIRSNNRMDEFIKMVEKYLNE